MTIVLDRLQRRINIDAEEIRQHASLSAFLDTQTATKQAFFKLLVDEDSSLVLEYNTLRGLLEEALQKRDLAEATPLAKELMELSAFLSEKYSHYINERPNLRKSLLQQHHSHYKKWLRVNVTHEAIPMREDRAHVDIPYEHQIRTITEWTNPSRLTALRLRRFAVLLIPIINDFDNYGSWILWADAYVAPFLTYLGLLFFLPRLCINTCRLLAHSFEHPLMSDEECSLGFWHRFNAQWERLWPNLTNDAGWAINGVFMCFVFIGSWQPMGIYFSLSMQLYDLSLASLRAYYEMERLNHLVQHYTERLPADAPFLIRLKEGVQREKNIAYLSLLNFTVLFIAISLAFPLFIALNPLLPAFGAAMAIVMTGINVGGRWLLNQPDPIHALKRMVVSYMPFFGSTPKAPRGLDELLNDPQALVIHQSQQTLHHSTTDEPLSIQPIPQATQPPLFLSIKRSRSCLLLSQPSPVPVRRTQSYPQLSSPNTVTMSLSISQDELSDLHDQEMSSSFYLGGKRLK